MLRIWLINVDHPSPHSNCHFGAHVFPILGTHREMTRGIVEAPGSNSDERTAYVERAPKQQHAVPTSLPFLRRLQRFRMVYGLGTKGGPETGPFNNGY